MLNVLYVVATFIATVIGALAGIGGGIVLKAMTDIFSPDSEQVISFYTTVVVFTMCLVSIVKQIKSGFKYDLPMLLEISVGSLDGGYIGDSLLTVLLRYFPENKVQLTQSIILFLTLIFLIIYTRVYTGDATTKACRKATLAIIVWIGGVFRGNINFFGHRWRSAERLVIGNLFWFYTA